MEDTVLFHQVFSVENIALAQVGAEFASEFIERSVTLIASRLDLYGADFATVRYQEVNLHRIGAILRIRPRIEEQLVVCRA